GQKKSELSRQKILIKAALSGAFLGFATTLAYTVTSQTGLGFLGALVFPTGFVMVLLFNLELVTGSFAMLPLALLKGKTNTQAILRKFCYAFIGNLLGALIYALLFYVSITQFGHVTSSLLIEKIIEVAETKTIAYKALGVDGMIVVIVNAMLCNWMVTMGAFIN